MSKYESIFDAQLDNFNINMVNGITCFKSNEKIIKKINKVIDPIYDKKININTIFGDISLFTKDAYLYEKDDINCISTQIIKLFTNKYKFTQDNFDAFIEHAIYKKSLSYISNIHYERNYYKIKNIVLYIMFNFYISDKQINSIINCFNHNEMEYDTKIKKYKYKSYNKRYFKSISILNKNGYIFNELQLASLLKNKCPYRYLTNSLSNDILLKNLEFPLKYIPLRTSAIQIIDISLLSLSKEQYMYYRPYDNNLQFTSEMGLQKRFKYFDINIFKSYKKLFSIVHDKVIITKYINKNMLDIINGTLLSNKRVSNSDIILDMNKQKELKKKYLNYSTVFEKFDKSIFLNKLINTKYYYNNIFDDYITTLSKNNITNGIKNGIITIYHSINISYNYSDLIYYLKNCQVIGCNAAFIIYDFVSHVKLQEYQIVEIFDILYNKNYINDVEYVITKCNSNFNRNWSILTKEEKFMANYEVYNNTDLYIKKKRIMNILFLKLIYIILIKKTNIDINVVKVHDLLFDQKTDEIFYIKSLNIDDLMKDIFVEVTFTNILQTHHIKTISNCLLNTCIKNRPNNTIINIEYTAWLTATKKNSTIFKNIKSLTDDDIYDTLWIKQENINNYYMGKDCSNDKLALPLNNDNDLKSLLHICNKINKINNSNELPKYIYDYIINSNTLSLDLICLLPVNLFFTNKCDICKNLDIYEKYFAYFNFGILNNDKIIMHFREILGNIVILRHLCVYETFENINTYAKTYNLVLDNYCKFALQNFNKEEYKKFANADNVKIKCNSDASTLLKRFCPTCKLCHPYIINNNILCKNNYCNSFSNNYKNINQKVKKEKKIKKIKTNILFGNNIFAHYLIVLNNFDNNISKILDMKYLESKW